MSTATKYTVEGIKELRLALSAGKMAELYRNMSLPELAGRAIEAGESHRANAINLFEESAKQVDGQETS